MGGWFTQHYLWEQVHAFLSVFGPPRNLLPRYNIAPTTMIDVVRPGAGGRELVPMRWGLVPGWWKKCVPEPALREWFVAPRLNGAGAGDDPAFIEPVAAAMNC